ncbi:MAG: hypothetical protein AB8H12_17380 [Lewinella sp.]
MMWDTRRGNRKATPYAPHYFYNRPNGPHKVDFVDWRVATRPEKPVLLRFRLRGTREDK